MKKFLLLCLTALLTLSAWAFDADNGDGIILSYNIVDENALTCEVTEGDYWDYEEINIPSEAYNEDDGNTYTVIGVGEYAFCDYEDLSSVSFPETLTHLGEYSFAWTGLNSVTIPKTITSMDEGAFYGCWALSELNLEPGLTYVGDYAFCECESLETLFIPNSITFIGEYAFYYCWAVSELTLEPGLTYVGDYSFCELESLETLFIPNSITFMGHGAFQDCLSLRELTLEPGLAYVGDYAFSNMESLEDLTIPSSITFMGEFAFGGCQNLSDITLEDGLTYLGNSAFERSSSLEKIVIPGSLTYVGKWAFDDCEILSDVTLSDGLPYISDYMFGDCPELTSINLPSSITSIGEYAFVDCNFSKIEIPTNVKTIGARAFSANNNVKSITLSEGLEYIGESAFYNCMSTSGSSALTIPESVTYIGPYAFRQCRYITDLTILASANTIENSAFYDCNHMESVTLSKSVYRLKNSAFYNCSAVTSFTSLNPEAPICDPNALGMSKSSCTIYVPKGSKEAYESADTWEDYNIVELDEEGETPPTDENRFMVDGIYYNITDADALTCEVTFATTSFNTYSGSVTIPETVSYNGKEYNVTGIGYSAFRTSKDLTEVIIPENITTIDSYAFYRCSSLKEISIPSGVSVISEYAFYECTALTEITIPATVTSVEDNAFGNCSNAKNLILEDSDTTLELVRNSFVSINHEYLYLGRNVNYDTSADTNSPFMNSGRNTLKYVTIGNKVTSLNTCEFYWCEALEELTIPGTVTNFGDHIFYHSGIKAVTIEEGITKLGDYMFYNCTALNNVTLPEGLTTLGAGYAFAGCTALEEITIPSTVTSGVRAFYQCTNLKDVTIREGVSAISNEMFEYCSSLIEIDLPSSISTIGSYAFGYCTSLERVNFKEGENSYYIGMEAFYHCENLTNLLLPTNVTYLGADAFEYCENMKKVVFPNQTANNSSPFRYCTALEEVILCAQAQSLNSYVASNQFNGCTSLSKLYVLSETAPNVANSNAFTNVPTETCVLYVPVGSKESYENNNYWKVFTNIEELSNPLPVTYCVGNVTSEAAQINGLVAVGSVGVTEVGFEYWAEGEEATTVAISNNFTTTSEINYTPANLTYNTKYTYRVYAKTASDTFYGDEVTFTSKEVTVAETLVATDITDHTAVLNGNVVVPYFNTLEEKGFEYWITQDDVQTVVVSAAGDGEFSAEVTELAYGTTYKYRTYAKIEGGFVYGEELTFTTELYAPAIETLPASDVAETSAVLNGTVEQGSELINRKGFVYWSDDPNVVEVIIIDDEDVEMSYTLSSLIPETTYTYRAFAVTDSGTTYGEDKVFTTLEDTTTGINGIRISLNDENVEGIYSTSGQKLSTTVKGVNIIRYNDGTVKKIYVK